MMTLSLTEGCAAAPVSTTRRAMLASPVYGKLPDHERPHLDARLAMCERIDAAKNIAVAIRTESLRTHAGRRLSEGAIRKLYYDRWRASKRDWQSLINRSRAPQTDSGRGVSADMIQHWHELYYRFMGRGAEAYRELEREWRNPAKPLPGYPDVRAWDLPRALSYSNLMRPKYRPPETVKRVARIGVRAAHDLLPSVLQTRAGVRPGAFYMFDDIWHDMECTVPGQLGMRRVLQFHALELLSACQIARGMKPEILNDKTGRMERLKEREMLFLLAHTLGSIGYNPEGCTLVMELGTATVDERVERLLSDVSGGLLKIERGTASGSPLAQGLYAGSSKGNFKLKAALESLGNLIHNATGDRLMLPAQSGSIGRVNQPEELHGRERHLIQLQKAAMLVPADLRARITNCITPSFSDAAQYLDYVQERINDRTDHDIEGWEACGFIAPLFRLAHHEAWKRQTELASYAEPLRAAIEAQLRNDPRLVSARRMSPSEVFAERVRPHLTVLPPHLIPQLIGNAYAVERRVAKDGRFHFADEDVGTGEHHYEGVALTPDGTQTVLRDGECYATFVSMLDPERMHVCDARGRYLGWAPRTLVPTRGDAEAFAKACGVRQAAARERLAPVLRAAAPLIKRDTEAAENATAMLAELGRTAEEAKAVKHADATNILLSRSGSDESED